MEKKKKKTGQRNAQEKGQTAWVYLTPCDEGTVSIRATVSQCAVQTPSLGAKKETVLWEHTSTSALGVMRSRICSQKVCLQPTSSLWREGAAARPKINMPAFPAPKQGKCCWKDRVTSSVTSFHSRVPPLCYFNCMPGASLLPVPVAGSPQLRAWLDVGGSTAGAWHVTVSEA